MRKTALGEVPERIVTIMLKKRQIAVLLALSCVAVFAGDWSWRIPTKMYQNLDFEKRATIDKAVEAYAKAEETRRQNRSVPDEQIPAFRAAAAEWKKYTVQYELDYDDEEVKAYVLFMEGMSLYGARDRNKAVKAFEELLDFYVDQKWITAAAQFMIGECQYANGENNKARNTFMDMVAEYPEFPLTARAYNRIASIYLYLHKLPEATQNWREAANPIFKDTASSDWNEATRTLPQVLAILGNWKALTDSVFEDKEKKTPKEVLNTLVWLEDTIMGNRWQWGQRWYDVHYQDKPGDKVKAYKEFDKGFSKWHESHKNIFLEGGSEWEYYRRAFQYRRSIDLQDAKKLIPDIYKCLKGLDEAIRPTRAKEFAMLLAEVRFFDEAHSLEEMIKDPIQRLWLSYEIDRRASKWDACILTLEQLIASKDPEISLSGKKTLAWLYKDCLHDFEKALKIYQEISIPPGTLWDIQYCYRRLGKKKESYATLNEITFFPDQAARAIWTMAEYYREDGEKEQAIALYRRLLSHPEWKKTGESSQAHQRLEAWGIATGGADAGLVR